MAPKQAIIWRERWPDFKPEEIFSPEQTVLLNKGIFPISFRSLDKLQDFRNFIGRPLAVNRLGHHARGARSTREVFNINRLTRGRDKGWEYSFHLWCAFDIDCPELDPLELFDEAVKFGLWGGVGLYDTFIHVDDRDDLRGELHTWDFRKKKR